MVELLLRRGANKEIRGSHSQDSQFHKGETALEMARG